MLTSIKPWTLLRKALPDGQLESFAFGLPLETLKSAAGDPTGRRGIQGVASTPKKDLQDEWVIQQGLDVRYFLNHGYYNDDHKPGAENKVGQPTAAEVKKVKTRSGGDVIGLWNAGYMWKEGLHAGADHLWTLANAIRNTPGSTRSMAFSIQGKVLLRESRKIVKAWVQDVAITPSPINTDTWLELCDQLSKSVWASEQEVTSLHKSITHHKFKHDELVDDDGWDEMGEQRVKSLVAASNPLVSQSLEANLKVLPWAEKENYLKKAMEFAYHTARSRGYSPSQARGLALATTARFVLS